MNLPDFNFYTPVSLQEATKLLVELPGAVAMAGGTDLLVEMKKGLRSHDNIVSLSKIEDLKGITEDEKYLNIGTCSTHTDVLASSLVRKFAPALAEGTSKIGSDQVRNTGTIGGNICTAASCCDTAPVLLAMNASIEVAGSGGKKTFPLSDFFTHNKKTILKNDDIVTRILIPKPGPATGACYEKFGLREAGSISVVSAAVCVTLKNDKFKHVCIVIGAVAPTPKISDQASTLLKGKNVAECVEGSDLLDQVGDAAVRDSIPIDDIRGGAQFRRSVLKVIVKRAVMRAIEVAK